MRKMLIGGVVLGLELFFLNPTFAKDNLKFANPIIPNLDYSLSLAIDNEKPIFYDKNLLEETQIPKIEDKKRRISFYPLFTDNLKGVRLDLKY